MAEMSARAAVYGTKKAFRIVRRTGTRAWNSKGARIFVKPPTVEPHDFSAFWMPYRSPDSPWRVVRGLHHLVDAAQWPVRIVTHLARGKAHDFTPLRGIAYHAVKRPTRWISAGLGWKRDPTAAITLPIELGLGVIPWVLYFNWTDDEIKKEAVASAKEHGAEWEALMKSDFRYQAFRLGREDGKITDEQAKLGVAVLNQMNAEYFEKRSQKFANSDEERDYYLGLPAFSDIDELREMGFQRVGFRKLAAFEEIPSDSTVNKLMENRHRLLMTQERVHQWIHGDPKTHSEGLRTAFREIERDSRVQYLVALEREGVLSKDELSYRIQEDFFWRDRFEAWKILGVEKLKKVDGQVTEQTLTLPDIRAELRADMATLPSKP